MKMESLGVSGLRKDLRSDNGTAQYLLMSVWGIISSTIFLDTHVSSLMLLAWVASSVWVMYATVFMTKKGLLAALRTDLIFTVAVTLSYLLSLFLYGIPDMGFFIGRVFAALALSLHAVYLTDLAQRQVQEWEIFEKLMMEWRIPKECE